MATQTETRSWGSFRFSTDDLPMAARAAAVRELHERASLAGKIEPLEPLPNRTIRVDIAKVALRGLGLMSGTLCGVRQAARPRSSVSGDDDLLLAVNWGGVSIAQQDDLELTLRDGDAMLATRGPAGFAINRPVAARFVGFRVPRGAVASLIGTLDSAPIQLLPHGSGVPALLVNYANAIIGGEPLRTPELRRLAVTHIHDLIAVALGATREAQAIAEGRGLAAARFRAVMADIAAHLGDNDLSAVTVARRQGVTPRYIHKFLEKEGQSFSAIVLDRRLAHAHRLLSGTSPTLHSISSVAFGVGFGDLSYFNRTFRRRYGVTPSEIRRAAK